MSGPSIEACYIIERNNMKTDNINLARSGKEGNSLPLCQPPQFGWDQSLGEAPCSAQNKYTSPDSTESKAEENHRAQIIALEKRGIASNLGAQFRGLVPSRSPQVF